MSHTSFKSIGLTKRSKCQLNTQEDGIHPRTSRVGEYIQRMKVKCSETKERSPKESHLSIEDLYLANQLPVPSSPEATRRELIRSWAALKQSDILISQLQTACQQLSLKCADAENRIDELRFIDLGIKKTTSEVHLTNSSVPQILHPHQTVPLSNQDVTHESCSNWMEKIHNWKTDNTSGDGDSGFRGSADLQLEQRLIQHSSNTIMCRRGVQGSTREYAGVSNISRCQSFNDLQFGINGTLSSKRLIVPHSSQLDKLTLLLDDTTTFARKVQKKSQILAKLLQSQRKRVG